jgi:hypothetical protein
VHFEAPFGIFDVLRELCVQGGRIAASFVGSTPLWIAVLGTLAIVVVIRHPVNRRTPRRRRSSAN